jgi:hypothetical protein
MKNRDSAHPGRIKLTPVDEANGIYDLTRADDPRDEGTPLNKKLLDFAVAACGVTAGTATAYTLDDEFGGFTLTEGAKVNFRLHVASSAGATLNVNGTGAKPMVNIRGEVIPVSIPAGAWITARYSSLTDSYMISNDIEPQWVTVTTSAATAVNIILPSEYNVFRLRGLFAPGDSTLHHIIINADISMNYSLGGANYDEFAHASNSGKTMNTDVYADDRGAGVDLIISRISGTQIQGAIIGSRGIGGFGAKSASRINSISLGVYGGSIIAGAVIILEGIE